MAGKSDSDSKKITQSEIDSNSKHLSQLVWIGFILYVVYTASKIAYDIRMNAINDFGPIIHEFDPYFNWRATEYLYENGWQKFVTWFDYKVWYPLGRPVGTTIYPGMQVTAVFIKRFILGESMSLNDICCYIPVWFGVMASALTGLIAYECTLPQNSSGTIFTFLVDIVNGKIRESENSSSGSTLKSLVIGVFSMSIMSMVPAHLMRSIGGGYDNESVAITAMTMTFWFWVRSLRAKDEKSYLYGIPTGIAYFYMVAVWGGYVFVLNMIGFHAAALVLLGRFSTKVYLSYSLFYVIGTALAVQVPVVGWTPFKSLEQLGPGAIFVGYQILQYCEIERKKKKLNRVQANLLRIKVSIAAAVVAGLFIYFLAPAGYFGPISARVRGLFVKHTKTGNPLVDSVAEHQPAKAHAYYQYLHYACYLGPLGFAWVIFNLGDASSFVALYALTTYFFSSKMVRLILLLGPVASICGGIVIGTIFAESVGFLAPWLAISSPSDTSSEGKETEKKGKSTKKGKKSSNKESPVFSALTKLLTEIKNSNLGKTILQLLAMLFFVVLFFGAKSFSEYCHRMSKALSHPTIVTKGELKSGKVVVVDDYREAYFWLRDNTPEDARVLSWWDYGYQITGIANRTTIADGNTWNHEHIALLGKVLTSSEEEGYEIARHLADYVLVWAGGGGDDLAKSPHLARIANSVYRDMCPGDPTCRAFGVMDKYGTPSPMMRESFLFKLHGHKVRPGVEADPQKFQEVFRSKYGKVRIYKILGVSRASKKWVELNRECDVPGSWFCPGKYPPALEPVLNSKIDFAQLEDFNTKKKDEEYQKAYFENLNNPNKANKNRPPSPKKQKIGKEEYEQLLMDAKAKLSPQAIEDANAMWADTSETTMMWEFINNRNIEDLRSWLVSNPLVGFIRSADGRGPMWWAYENRNMDVAMLLTKLGVPNNLKDKYGQTPIDLLS